MTFGMNPRSWRLRFPKEHVDVFQRSEDGDMNRPLHFHWRYFEPRNSEREKKREIQNGKNPLDMVASS